MFEGGCGILVSDVVEYTTRFLWVVAYVLHHLFFFLQELGYKVPQPMFEGPSSFIPQKEVS